MDPDLKVDGRLIQLILPLPRRDPSSEVGFTVGQIRVQVDLKVGETGPHLEGFQLESRLGSHSRRYWVQSVKC